VAAAGGPAVLGWVAWTEVAAFIPSFLATFDFFLSCVTARFLSSVMAADVAATEVETRRFGEVSGFLDVFFLTVAASFRFLIAARPMMSSGQEDDRRV
jgi:hypothetical protein